RERVRIALPLRDGFRDFGRLASFHARHGRRIYGAFTPHVWRAVEHNGKLEGFVTRPLARVGWFELRELSEGERSARRDAPRPTLPRSSR
nr:hypothetical protein [Myxococcota bacterium]